MAKEDHQGKSLPEIAEILGVDHCDTHLFICTGPDCCTEEAGMAAWQVIKRTVKMLNPKLNRSRIYRTKVSCLRFCQQGPIAVAYPQGQWFHHVTEDNAEDIVKHLQSGSREPHRLEFTRHPLPQPGEGAAPE